jgi:hypothetical protein
MRIKFKRSEGHSNAPAFVSSAKVQIFRCDRRNSDVRGGIVLGFNPHLESSACDRGLFSEW